MADTDVPRREYSGTTTLEALDDFKNRNVYPDGLIALELPGVGRMSFGTHGPAHRPMS